VPVPDGVEEFDRLIGDTLRALRPPPTAADAGAAVEPVDLRGEGVGLNGQLRVTAVAGGRVESVHIDPRAMRTDSRTLGEELVVATNAALAAVRAKVQEAAGEAGPDTAALADRLREVQGTAVPRMRSFLRAVEELRRQASGEAGR
jgi:DNA-binding protein YbaB